MNTRVKKRVHIHHSSLTELDLRWNFSGNKDDYVEEALMDLERFCSRNLTLAVQSYAKRERERDHVLIGNQREQLQKESAQDAQRHSQRPVVPVRKASSVFSSTTLSMLQAGEAPGGAGGEAGSASAPERVRRG